MTSTAPTEGEDVLLSEARIISETHDSQPPPERPFPTGNFDPRTAIFRAREAYRERARAKAAAERNAAGAEASSGARLDEDIPDPGSDATAFGGEAVRPESSDHQSFTQNAATPSDEPAGWFVEQNVPEVVGADAELGTVQIAGDYEEGLHRRSRDPGVDSSDSGVISTLAQATAEQSAEGSSSAPAEAETAVAMRLDQTAGDEGLPDWFRTDLPRICRACRDYRPSADGQRGWCANAWAFTHRRLVHEDDVAPCQSTIGDWWVPVDDVWLVAADVSSHGRATPLLDRMTADSGRQRRRL